MLLSPQLPHTSADSVTSASHGPVDFTTLPCSIRQANSHPSQAEDAKVASCQCSILASLPPTQGLDEVGHICAAIGPSAYPCMSYILAPVLGVGFLRVSLGCIFCT